jgi:hypothetical protein
MLVLYIHYIQKQALYIFLVVTLSFIVLARLFSNSENSVKSRSNLAYDEP